MTPPLLLCNGSSGVRLVSVSAAGQQSEDVFQMDGRAGPWLSPGRDLAVPHPGRALACPLVDVSCLLLLLLLLLLLPLAQHVDREGSEPMVSLLLIDWFPPGSKVNGSTTDRGDNSISREVPWTSL